MTHHHEAPLYGIIATFSITTENKNGQKKWIRENMLIIECSTRMTPQCVMWCIWREHNPRKFKDHERMTLVLEDLLSKTLLWVDGSY